MTQTLTGKNIRGISTDRQLADDISRRRSSTEQHGTVVCTVRHTCIHRVVGVSPNVRIWSCVTLSMILGQPAPHKCMHGISAMHVCGAEVHTYSRWLCHYPGHSIAGMYVRFSSLTQVTVQCTCVVATGRAWQSIMAMSRRIGEWLAKADTVSVTVKAWKRSPGLYLPFEKYVEVIFWTKN